MQVSRQRLLELVLRLTWYTNATHDRLSAANDSVVNNVEDTDVSSMTKNQSAVDNGRAAVEKAGQAQKSMVDDVLKMLGLKN